MKRRLDALLRCEREAKKAKLEHEKARRDRQLAIDHAENTAANLALWLDRLERAEQAVES